MSSRGSVLLLAMAAFAAPNTFAEKWVGAAIKEGTEASKSNTAKVFVETLNDKETQSRLKKLYKLDDKTYKDMFRLTMGIVAAETKNGESGAYKIKERLPWAISSLKEVSDTSDRWRSNIGPLDKLYIAGDIWHDYRHTTKEKRKKFNDTVALGTVIEIMGATNKDVDPEELIPFLFDVDMNSRGATQIKYLPTKLQKQFPHINKNNLKDDANAAIATMAYLAEAMPRLKYYAKKGGFEIPEGREVDHLIYIYRGLRAEIEEGTATVDDNRYFREVKQGFSEYVFDIYDEDNDELRVDERDISNQAKDILTHKSVFDRP